MDLRIVPDEAAVARQAADVVVELLSARPAAHLCLAAGRSPRPLYAELARRARAGECSLDRAAFTQLDEWHGLRATDRGTCAADLRDGLLDPLGVPPARCLTFATEAPDAEAECARVAARLAARGAFDLCILGLGLNGHLGLNEPAEELHAGAHVAELSESTRRHHMLAHLAEPPRFGLTLGMADLMHAARVLVLVSGGAKREALARLVHGPLTTWFPASLLQLHAACLVLADADAGGRSGV
jgi:galactosamine-6-phosphate isomerase